MDKFKDFTLNPMAYAAPKMQVSRVAPTCACAYGILLTTNATCEPLMGTTVQAGQHRVMQLCADHPVR